MSKSDYVQYGCGVFAPEGWRNFDASPTLRFERLPLVGRLYTRNQTRFPVNVEHGDIVKGLPVGRGTCRALYCSHVLEHLTLEDARLALRHTREMLREDGCFRSRNGTAQEGTGRDWSSPGSRTRRTCACGTINRWTRNCTRPDSGRSAGRPLATGPIPSSRRSRTGSGGPTAAGSSAGHRCRCRAVVQVRQTAHGAPRCGCARTNHPSTRVSKEMHPYEHPDKRQPLSGARRTIV